MSQRALLLINRHARQGQQDLTSVIEQLKGFGLTLIEASTEDRQQLPELIRRHRDQVDLVIVGGGDGTLNAAIEGLVDTQLPLAILPLGTANDLARTLGIPSRLSDACTLIQAGKLEQIDLGWVNGNYFFNVASLGLSVKITRQLDQGVKQRWGALAYAVTALKVLWNARPFWVELQIEGQERRQMNSVQLAIGNGRYYGGGLTVAQDAAIDDQWLDVYSLNLKHWWQILPLLPTMRSGNHTVWPFVDHIRCRSLSIGTRRPLAINTDGELTTATPAQFRVVPLAISVLVPDSR